MNTFKVTDPGKKHILTILENYPYVQVVNYVKLLEKNELTEEESNSLLNYLGTLNFKMVADFFNKANTYFSQVENEVDSTDKNVYDEDETHEMKIAPEPQSESAPN